MGFLQRTDKNQFGDADEELEKQYEKLFAKIGRDFVFKEDLVLYIESLLRVMLPGVPMPIVLDDAMARNKASEYKEHYESDEFDKKRYEDLINLDD